jgi:hypothetical protein
MFLAMCLAMCLAIVLGSAACDLGRVTVNTTAKVLVRALPALQQESDFQLAHDAFPATLKTIEGFWVVNPDNEDLFYLLTEGYCQYGTGFVEDDWEIAKFAQNLAEIEHHNARATHIFTRCLNYALRQLGARWQAELFGPLQGVNQLLKDTGANKRDQMMWAALALGSIVNHNLKNPDMLSSVSTVRAILDRVIEIDGKTPPSRRDYAALPHIAYGMLLTAVAQHMGGDPARAKAEFELALKLTDNKFLLARTLMGYRVGVITNDRKFFHDQLKQVLDKDPAVWPEQRLANEIAHRRARRYLSHEKELFP